MAWEMNGLRSGTFLASVHNNVTYYTLQHFSKASDNSLNITKAAKATEEISQLPGAAGVPERCTPPQHQKERCSSETRRAHFTAPSVSLSVSLFPLSFYLLSSLLLVGTILFISVFSVPTL